MKLIVFVVVVLLKGYLWNWSVKTGTLKKTNTLASRGHGHGTVFTKKIADLPLWGFELRALQLTR